MIEIKDIITLSNQKQYVVASKANFESKIYYLLINEDNIKDIILVYQKDENNVTIVNNDIIFKQLIPLFLKETRKSITDEDLKIIFELENMIEEDK